MSIRIKTVNVLCGLVFGLAPAWAEDTYVTDGLIHRYDGIDNVAVGVHDESQRVWNDLVSTAPINLSMDLNPVNKAVLTAKSVLGKETSHKFFLAASDEAPSLADAGVKAFEVVIRSTAYQKNQASTLLARLWKDRSAELILRNNHTIGNDTIGYFPCGGTASNDFTTVTVLIESRRLYLNGVEVERTSTSQADVQMNKPYYFVLGGEPDNNSYPFEGEIFACRIYTRELDAAEIAANAQTDANRFFPHRTCYVVPEDADSTPTPPYSSWATAAKSLTNALAVVTEGWGEVILSNGTHHISRPTITVVTGEIAIRGFGGREETIIDADGSIPPLQLNCPEALLTGLTIQGVYNKQVNYGSVDINKGRIEDCIVRNNTNDYHGVGVRLRTEEASMSRCIVTNNMKITTVQGGVLLQKAGIVIDNCYIADNKANYGETINAVAGVIIRNCTLGVGKQGASFAIGKENDKNALIGTFVNCAFLMQPVCNSAYEFHLTNCAATGDIDPNNGKAGSTVDGLKVMSLAEMDALWEMAKDI